MKGKGFRYEQNEIYMRRITSILANSILMFAATLLVLIVAEVSLRFLRPGYEYAAKARFVRSQSRIWENPLNATYCRPHPDLQKSHLVLHNSLGLRQHREFSPDKPPHTLRIGFFGDSMTENLRMEVQYAFTEVLDYLLNRAGIKVEVLNFGTDGYGTGQVYLQYLQEGLDLDLDLVFYVYSSNDLRNIRENDLVDLQEGQLQIKDVPPLSRAVPLLNRLYLTYLVIDFLNRLETDTPAGIDPQREAELQAERKSRFKQQRYLNIQYHFAEGKISPEVQRTLAVFRAILEAMQRDVEVHDARFYTVTLMSDADRQMQRFLEKTDVTNLSLYEDFHTIYQGHEYRFQNDGHWNEEGNKLAAIIMFRFIADALGREYPGEAFVEQALYEYYQAFPEMRVSPRFLKQHRAIPDTLSRYIQTKYLQLEQNLPEADRCESR